MAQNIRPAAVAGQFYAKNSKDLESDLWQCYDEAETIAPLSKAERDDLFGGQNADSAVRGGHSTVQAVIVPHAGYVFSGAVAASAFMRIPKNAHYDRVFLLGPSHHVAFDGASVAAAFTAYQTPLGNVPVDTAVCQKLLSDSNVFCYKPSAHDREHCLEVELPFLQYRLDSVPPIVPIIIGTQNMGRLKEIARALKLYFTPNNLFVISSDFSHYPSYDNAKTVDGNTGKALETGRIDNFVEVLATNNALGIPNLYTSACGQSAIAVMLLMAQNTEKGSEGLAPGVSIHHIAYLNSGDSPYGGKSEVVGYHAFTLLSEERRGKLSEESKSERDEKGFELTEEDKEQLLNLAWNAISPARLHKPVKATEVFGRKLGAFVTLTENGRLRGCIGHFGEDIPLEDVVKEMAHAAAFEDPRFTPLREDELDKVSIEISVLTPLKRIRDISEFHYGMEGIYMRKGFRSGTFLPQVADEVNWTKEEFLGHCAQDKAGIGWDGWRTADLYTYEALRFSTD